MNVTLPWPPRALHPNAREHWSKIAKAKASYRMACFLLAKEAGARRAATPALHLTITFYPPNRRAHDLDGCLAAIKSGLDGLADALQVDDSRWALTIRKADEIGGMVRVEIGEAA